MRSNSLRKGAARVLLALAIATAPASAGAPEEYALKAAYLYNFVKYIEWPDASFATDADPYRVCVVGRDPFGDRLAQAIGGKTVRNRGFAVERFDAPGEVVRACHVLFVAGDEAFAARVLETLGQASVVTVGEGNFARAGGVASFVRTAKGFTVELNMRAARERELRVSARLQQVSAVVAE
jgi:hypothetical protein